MKRAFETFLFGLLSAFCLSIFSSDLRAAEISSGMLAPEVGAIYIKGEIKLDDLARFENIAMSFPQAIIFLESPGGNAAAGREIGSVVRRKAFSTYVAAGAECASACAFIWLAGKPRLLAPTAKVGFHAVYRADTQQESGVGNALVGAFLTSLGLSLDAIAYITKPSPTEIKWLNADDAKRINLDVQVIVGTPTAATLSAIEDTHSLSGQGGLADALANAEEAHKKGDYATALRIFHEYAMSGDATAQYSLGYMYRNGEGIPQNYTEALKWYRRAAEQGNVRAQYNLGLMYGNGEGLPRDYVEANTWFHQAAEQGFSSAQYNLAVDHERGHGTPQNHVEAAKWYRRAAEQDNVLAQLNLGYAYDYGQGVPQDRAEAIKWYRRAADLGNALAQFNLGQKYENGEGVERAPKLALIWFRRAAEQGLTRAQNNLATIYHAGNGVKRDYVEAEKWFRRAAEQGDPLGQFNLGLMYANGQGMPPNDIVAHVWFNLASAQGQPRAIGNRDKLAQRMTPAQPSEAQRLAREWKPKSDR